MAIQAAQQYMQPTRSASLRARLMLPLAGLPRNSQDRQEEMLTVSELEERMRPGAWSSGGFLGPIESLESVITHDAQILARYRISYEPIADALERVLRPAIKHTKGMSPYPDLYKPETVPHFDLNNLPEITEGYTTGNLQVFTIGYRGIQECPWGCKAGSSCDFLILNRQTGESVTGSYLVVHLIREHHFFEGMESPYRTDPTILIRVLELC